MTHCATVGLGALRPRLLRRARRYTSDPAAAEDLAQEALLRVWARLQQEPPVDDLERYLFTALRNISQRRRAAEAALTEAEMPAVAPRAADRLAAGEVLAEIARLPAAQARLILEHGVGGTSYAELARRHGLPVGTVMSRVARGRARLCDRLDLPRDRPVAAILGRR